MSSPSILSTAEYYKLSLIAAGVNLSDIPPILDTATWRHMMLAALYQISSGGGGGGYISGVVDTYNDLPVTVGTPALNTVYLVRFGSGVWLINRKPGGLYIRIANNGTLADWEYLSAFPEVQSDLRWRVYNDVDPTKEVALDVSNVSTGTVRTLEVPNASGRIQIEGQPIGDVTPASGAFTTLSANNGTLTASAPVLDLAQTWNASGVTFTGIKADFTNTASASGSLLMDLQVGGTSQFWVRRDGMAAATALRHPTSSTTAVLIGGTGGFNSATLAVGSQVIRLTSITPITWGPGANHLDGADLVVLRDAAQTLAQRNGTNAQTFNIYNTYTDSTNYERGFLKWDSNTFQIGTEAGASGGSQRNMIVRMASGRTIFCDCDTVDFRSATFSTILRITTTSVQFSGTTSAFPALKRNSTTLQVRLADDSAFTAIQGKLTTETAYTAGAPTATGYLVIYDSNGTAYKVPAEAL